MQSCRAALGSLFIWAVACGAPAEPAKGPDAAAESEGAPREAAEGDAAAKSDAPATDGASSGAPASQEDVNAIMQLVVNDSELDGYLHLGEPGRFPLQISGEKLPSGLKLIKGNEPVKVVDAPKSKKDPVLVITEIDVQGDKATVRYRYDIEGIRGTATLAKLPHGWEMKNSRVVEH